MLVDVSGLERAYHKVQPDGSDPMQRVSFGTSGHRGSSLNGTFNEAHVWAIAQAICVYRSEHGHRGPVFLAMDTHALSAMARRSVLEVLAANGVETRHQSGPGIAPTPAISHAILEHNRAHPAALADGIILTPSHNPPADGGIKYNPPHGGPADTDVTARIEGQANALLGRGNREVRRMPFERAVSAACVQEHDFIVPYVEDLPKALDLEAIREAGVRIGVDPLGGAALPCWEPIQRLHRLDLTVVNPRIDPQFGFMPADHDGRIRMDCSSPFAMAGLIGLKDQYAVAFGNDPDADRHGIVTPTGGLMNPNHYLAAAIEYLLTHRTGWDRRMRVGKTVVSSRLIDRVVAERGWSVLEVPVGFKYFAAGLARGELCFGGEESAGASFLCRDGAPWSTDKDGLLLGLLAAEMTARGGKNPAQRFNELAGRLGMPHYRRLDAPATPEEKAAFRKLTAESVRETELAGERIESKLTRAPGNGAEIGGLKVATASGWFAARPSGTENLYKLYAESFRGPEHLERIVAEARALVSRALAG